MSRETNSRDASSVPSDPPRQSTFSPSSFREPGEYNSEPMAHYISCHTIACMTLQQIGYLEALLRDQPEFRTIRSIGSQISGKLLLEFESSSREAIEQVFSQNNIHCDWLIRVEFERIWKEQEHD